MSDAPGHLPQPHEGKACSRRGCRVDDGAPSARSRSPRSPPRRVRYALCRSGAQHAVGRHLCQICISAQQIGITPLVRVPANTPEYICRVLDGGAMGVITPHVRSAAEEARAMVELVKFPPLGHRSAGGPLSQYQYRSFPMAQPTRR